MLRDRADDRPSCNALDAFAATFGLVTFDDDFMLMTAYYSSPADTARAPAPSAGRGAFRQIGRTPRWDVAPRGRVRRATVPRDARVVPCRSGQERPGRVARRPDRTLRCDVCARKPVGRPAVTWRGAARAVANVQPAPGRPRPAGDRAATTGVPR